MQSNPSTISQDEIYPNIRLRAWPEVCAIIRPLSEDERLALAASIARDGVLQAVKALPDGRIIDGHHRWELANGNAPVEVYDIPERDAFRWALELNSARRHLSKDDLRRMALALREVGVTQAETASAVGIPRQTLSDWERQERVSNADSGITNTHDLRYRIEANDKNDIKERVEAGESSASIAADYDVSASRIRQIANEPDGHERTAKLAPLMTSDSEEWYTPAHVLDCVLATLGSIDLDPCSNSHANPNVPAGAHYTLAEDGLRQRWHGRVYMNPPYGSGIGQWTEKLTAAYTAGDVRAAVALVPARTDTAWFRGMGAKYVCFISGRLKFSGYENSAPFPSAAVYFGPEPERFIAAFQPYGEVYQKVVRS